MLKCFKGVRLPRNAAPTPPTPLAPPDQVLVPLRQHRGRPCKISVRPGDAVLMGQVIGASEAQDAALVHSPVSGSVEELIDTFDPGGQIVPTLVLANDGKDSWWDESQLPVPARCTPGEVSSADPEGLLNCLRQAGLVRATAHGLPLHLDLAPPSSPTAYLHMTGKPLVREIDTLIIRAVDHDPPICPNESVMAMEPPEMELGIQALVRITGAERVVIAVPSADPPARVMEMAAEQGWELFTVNASRYPSAAHELLIHRITGRQVPTPYGHARDVGVALTPLTNAVDMGKVLVTARPVLERVFCLAGDVVHPQPFLVRLGTPVRHIIKAGGGWAGTPGKGIIGGPMSGFAHFDKNTPVTKETGGLFLMAEEKIVNYSSQPCIHCGRCVSVCPVNLLPAELSKLCEFQKFAKAAEANLFNCIECGCCAYVCPSRRPMVHFVRYGKNEVLGRRGEA